MSFSSCRNAILLSFSWTARARRFFSELAAWHVCANRATSSASIALSRCSCSKFQKSSAPSSLPLAAELPRMLTSDAYLLESGGYPRTTETTTQPRVDRASTSSMQRAIWTCTLPGCYTTVELTIGSERSRALLPGFSTEPPAWHQHRVGYRKGIANHSVQMIAFDLHVTAENAEGSACLGRPTE